MRINWIENRIIFQIFKFFYSKIKIFQLFKFRELKLPNFQVMLYDWYRLRIQDIQDFPIHVFLKILIPYSRFPRVSNWCVFEDVGPMFKIFQNLLERSSRIPVPVFHNFEKPMSNNYININYIFPKTISFFLICESQLVYPKLKRIGCGSHGHVR